MIVLVLINILHVRFDQNIPKDCGSQWPRGLRRKPTVVHVLRLWARIPLGAWIFVVSVVCFHGEIYTTS